MLRSQVIAAIITYLQSAYEGDVVILPQENDTQITPPCAVVRIGSAEDMGMAQFDLWDMNVLVGVFHDADATTISAAETAAAAVFATLADTEAVLESLAGSDLLPSAWVSLTQEASATDNGWQHVAAYRLIVAPTIPVPDPPPGD